jgi:hypothetical protein
MSYTEKALDLEPCFEPAHQELMRIFHLSGRRDAVESSIVLAPAF